MFEEKITKCRLCDRPFYSKEDGINSDVCPNCKNIAKNNSEIPKQF